MRAGRRTQKDVDLVLEGWPQKFPYIKLVTATNNFMEAKEVGEGGFGVVYRGFLIDLTMEVAIKSHDETQYETEVKIMSRLRHRNLIRLIGYSHHKHRLLLVYEFAPNGNLSSHLFDSKKPPLSWAQRQKIALGLARALRYLHEECVARYVVHRDVKSANVLLDENYEVKLADFGLAMVGDHGRDLQETGVWGTVGYLAPEYQCTGRFSKGSDVYSFGVVVLEIACGRKAMDLVRPSVTAVKATSHQILSLTEKGEYTADLPVNEVQCLKKAFDGLEGPFASFIEESSLRPDWIIFNFAQYLSNTASHAFIGPPLEFEASLEQLTAPPKWALFKTTVTYRAHEVVRIAESASYDSSGVSDGERVLSTRKAANCSSSGLRSCFEFEADWLNVLRTEAELDTEQLRELALGLESSGLPFAWGLRILFEAPSGSNALPDGFEDRTNNRGLVSKGWVPQLRILAHDAVGGFLTHYWWSLITEGLHFGRVFVGFPIMADQGLKARVIVEKKVGLEVPGYERDESFKREEGVAEALRVAMVEEEGGPPKANARLMKGVFADKALHDR
ncbi:L-type lectin-domain containing receptor kinase IX.1 [Acorus calamus]|uniref:L-type lectin-domain containing receptor kinase IX.1 n=1 Tax=Acorus calamus TaxID=4465 RepID=A0AAV9EUF8_ACOCL|nr:L-type lectin-domain containing receptor kinase IX.1 [Acorus calamus]